MNKIPMSSIGVYKFCNNPETCSGRGDDNERGGIRLRGSANARETPRGSIRRFLVLMGLFLLAAPSASAEIRVDSIEALQSAVKAAVPGDEIVIAGGAYSLQSPVFCTASGTADQVIRVRGATAGAVTIRVGTSMGFEVSSPYWTFEDLDIQGVCASDSECEHAFHIVGRADHTVVRNCVMRDFNAQIKGNGSDIGGTMVFPNDVLIENSELFNVAARSTGNPVTPIDVVGGKRWMVRANFIHDHEKGGSDHVSYAAFFKGNSSDGVFERNLVVCEWLHRGGIRLGLSFGGGGSDPASICENSNCSIEHSNGIMRNNIIAHCPADVGIYLNEAANARIYNNILYDTKGIDVRFLTSSADLRNNILSSEIRERDGGTAVLGTNLQDVPLEDWTAWYVDPDNLDFYLIDGRAIVDVGESLFEVPDDYCTNDRDDGLTDLGPVEYDGESSCVTTQPYEVVAEEDPGCGTTDNARGVLGLGALALFPAFGIVWRRVGRGTWA